MANLKYELLKDDFTFFQGKKLFRIRALKNIGEYVKAGDLGGYIESEENLSANGDCWVFDQVLVLDRARIIENACARNGCIITGDAWLFGNVGVYGSVYLSGVTRVGGNSIISDYR